MGSFLSCMVLEAASCFAATTCRCATKIMGCSGSIATRVGYALLFLVNSLISWFLLSDWAIERLRGLFHGYLAIHCPEGYCYGVVAVHRMALAMSLFHGILGCLMIGVNSTRDPRAQIQNGWWGPKVLVWMLLVLVSFVLPNQVYVFWGNYVALFGAGIFILLQLILLVDFAHSWCERCLANYEDRGQRHWLYILIGSTTGLMLFALVATILLYVYFGSEGCRLNQFFISLNFVLAVLATVMSVHPWVREENPRSGIAQASMVAAYITYVIASALVNSPVLPGEDGHCNPLSKSRSSQTTAILLGASITLVAIVYSTSRAAVQGEHLMAKADRETGSDTDSRDAELGASLINNQPTASQGMRLAALKEAVDSGALPASALTSAVAAERAHNQSGITDDTEDADGVFDDEQNECAYHYSFFHLIFALAAMYVAMLLTDWNSMAGNPKDLLRIGQSYTAVWVRVVSSWICVLLYVWTLIAPALFPGRFSG